MDDVKTNLICIAEIVGVHGIKGMLKVKTFSDAPEKLKTYMPLCDANGKNKFDFLTFVPHKNIYLATLDGITNRTDAEKLRGTKLYISRESLPEIKDKDTWYHIDLIGLTAKNPEGKILGKIIQVANFGAGDLLEIKPLEGTSYYVPFTETVVPKMDMEKHEIIVDVPKGLLN